MSIITFWNNGEEQSGKTLSLVSIATYMAIEHNYKILIVSTGYDDKTVDNCYWQEKEILKKNFGIFGPNTNSYIGNGMDGLIPVMRSNKLTPNIVTNYTKIIFKDRLEVLKSFRGNKSEYKEATNMYADIINLANKYYDLVLVDLDNEVGQENIDKILTDSTLIVACLSQRLSSVNKFMEIREKQEILKSPRTVILIGRHDGFSKYTMKNLTRYMKEKNKISIIPYNTLLFEAAEEAGIPDLFLRLRKLRDDEDRNYLFMEEVRKSSENILYRLQDLQMKM